MGKFEILFHFHYPPHLGVCLFNRSIPTIRYTILPKSWSFVICWSEGVTNVRRYNLNANMLNVESVLNFPGCREQLKKIQFFDSKLLELLASSELLI